MADRTERQQAEVEEGTRLLAAAFDARTREEAVDYVDQIASLLEARHRRRAEFNRELDQAFEDKKSGPEFPTDPISGRTRSPEGEWLTAEETEPLPTTGDVKLSGKGLVEAIKRGRKLPGPGGWVRIAEDAPYTGPPMAIRRDQVMLPTNRFLLRDLMGALVQRFGQTIPNEFEVITPGGQPVLSDSDKDRLIDMLTTRVAELEAGK
jgi:hypothetical protein